MRTVFVNSNILNILNENIIKDELPDFLISDVEDGKTAFSKNPGLLGTSFLTDLYRKRFNEIVSNLKAIKKIEHVKSSDTNHALGEIIEECKKEEQPYKDKLEALCAKFVIDMFEIPEDSIEFDISMVDEVNIDSHVVQFNKIEDKSDYSKEIEDKNFNNEVYKRQIISALNIGYGMLKAYKIRDYIADIYEINPRLIDLYREFVALSEYSLFTNSHEKMTEKHNLQIGTVQLNISQVDEVPVIQSRAIIFPVLVCETIRGIMELFSSHGLPNEKKIASEVLKRTDYLLAEPWYMRTGLSLWEIINGQVNNIDDKLFPYLYRRICTLDANSFIKLMQQVLSKTNRGKNMLSVLADRAKSDFNDCAGKKMTEPDIDSTIITDNYIREDEL